MLLTYLDEFGHVGPFVSRHDRRYKASPVFGMGGLILPEQHARAFAVWFFQFKQRLLAHEIAKVQMHPATWEKKGTSLFTAKAVRKYPSVRDAGKRLFNHIDKLGGHIFFYGREKYQKPEDSHAIGLHKTVLSHSMRRLNALCTRESQYFMLILDQHSSRKDLLETAAKTMFGDDPTPRLIEPPFEVESHLYQIAQAADWIAAILGHLWAYRLEPTQFPEAEIFEKFYGRLVTATASHSTVERKPHWVRRPYARRAPAAAP